MKQLTVPKEYSVKDVQKQFSDWRKNKTPGSPIPQELWKAAAHLTKWISVSKVARALRLNYTDLLSQIEKIKDSDQECTIEVPSFFELPPHSPPPPNAPACIVEMENRHGDKMKMTFSTSQTLNFVELGRTFLGVQS